MEDRLQIIFYRHGKELNGWAENIRYHQERFIMPYNPYWEDVRIKPMDIETLLYRLLVIFSGFAIRWYLGHLYPDLSDSSS